jgi:hypothetical protein
MQLNISNKMLVVAIDSAALGYQLILFFLAQKLLDHELFKLKIQ